MKGCVIMKKILFKNNKFLLFFAMCLATLCWFFTLIQTVSNNFLSTVEAIPAFQSYTVNSNH